MPYVRFAVAVLEDWREVQREVSHVPSGSKEAGTLLAEAERLRIEYGTLIRKAHDEHRPEPPPFPGWGDCERIGDHWAARVARARSGEPMTARIVWPLADQPGMPREVLASFARDERPLVALGRIDVAGIGSCVVRQWWPLSGVPAEYHESTAAAPAGDRIALLQCSE